MCSSLTLETYKDGRSRLARGSLDDADAALHEAYAVLGETQRERSIANTSGLAEVAFLRGDLDQASALLADARSRYALRHDVPGITTVDARLAQLQSTGDGASRASVARRASGRPPLLYAFARFSCGGPR